MELNFIKKGNVWEAEFEATSSFNIHIEMQSPSVVTVYQRGSSTGKYASISSFNDKTPKSVFDRDFAALIYPKWIKVVSGSDVISSEVTFG